MAIIEFEKTYKPSDGLKRAFGEILVALAGVKSMSQADLSRALETSQPRISDLYAGKFDKFSSDWLFNKICALGYLPIIKFDTNKGWHGGEFSIQLRNKGDHYNLELGVTHEV
jgi:hypothetical protein